MKSVSCRAPITAWKHRSAVLGTIAATMVLSATSVYSIDPCNDNQLNPHPCGDCDNPAAPSRCWFSWARGVNGVPMTGFPLNVSLWQAVSPCDYPPISNNQLLGTSPLVSAETSSFVGQSPFRERAVHNGLIDMVTGLPLIREVDFELPFGGAVFRHVRTYSEVPRPAVAPDYMVDYFVQSSDGAMWDWNGMNWMMSENPLFLIDFSMKGLVEGNDPPRCYFIPDAHHAIPFIKSTSQDHPNRYVAPPWFDAVLKAGEAVDGDGRPTHFYLWLHGGAIKYTIEAHYEDMWLANSGVNAHERPNWGTDGQGHPVNSGGYGIPHYGLVKQIEDRYGNKVEIEHCGPSQSDCENDGLNGDECCQNCDQKGQIRFIKLYPAGSASAAWTLIYVHRGFANESIPPSASSDPAKYWPHLRDQHSLHSIRAYANDLDENSIPSCQTLTIPAETFCGEMSLSDLDAVDLEALPGDWKIQCKYLYSEFGKIEADDGVNADGEIDDESDFNPCADNLSVHTPTSQPTSQPAYIFNPSHAPTHCQTANLFKFVTPGWAWSASDATGELWSGRRLVKATVNRRQPGSGGQGDETSQTYTVYRDGIRGNVQDLFISQNWPIHENLALNGIYRDSAIRQIVPPDGSSEFDVYRFMSMYENCPVNVKEGDEVVSRPIKDLAEVYMYHDRATTGWGASGIRNLMNSVGMDGPRCFEAKVGRGRVRFNQAVRGEEGRGEFVYYQAFRFPSDVDESWLSEWTTHIAPLTAPFFHFPFRFNDPNPANPNSLRSGLLAEPQWVTVIDELDEDPTTNYQVATSSGPPTGVKSRRCVEINPTGFVISDRTWRFEDGAYSQTGFSEKFKYDCKGRMLERRSRGWDSLANENRDTDGLIHFFEYEDGNCPPGEGDPPPHVNQQYCHCPTIELTIDPENPQLYEAPPSPPIAEGVMKGANGASLGQKFYTRVVQRGIEGRPELVTGEIRFPEPVTDRNNYDASLAEITETLYEFYGESGQTNFWLTPIKQRTVIKPPVRRSMGDETFRSGVERVRYTETGSPQWTGIGSLANPNSFGDGDEFTVGLNLYDVLGRPVVQIADFDPAGDFPNHLPAGVELPESFADGFQRVTPAGQSPEVQRNFTTAIEYQSDIAGPSRIILPDGKEHRFATVRQDKTVFEWAFRNISFNAQSGIFSTTTPVEITRLDSGKMAWQRKVNLLEGDRDNEPDGRGEEEVAAADSSYSGILSETIPSYDANGRPIGVSQSGGGSSISAAIDYDGFGNINRQEEPDGTITRTVYDELGRLSRVYRGTQDENYYWGTALPWPPPCLEEDPPCDPPPPQPIDNMVLVEKRYYGLGVTDAGLLTHVRNYREKPENQYSVPCQPDPCPPSDEDTIGWVTEHQYDWRMRECWVQQSDSGGQPLSHTLTWMDNLSRPRFVAEYGDEAPAGVDPRAMLAVDFSFTAANILNASPRARSLTEYVYNRRGLVEETRRYNVDTGTYLSTLTFYDHLDRQCEVRAPNSPIMRYTYDAKGRRLSSQTWTGTGQTEVEVARSESVYDDDDRVIKSISYERLPGTEHGPVNAGNSVRTFVHNWYDHAGRLVATANYGSYNSTYSPSTSAEPAYNPDIETGIPTSSDAVLVTRYGYDDAGRQDEVTHPDGTVTRTEYDGLGRVTLTIENADSTDSNLIRRTAYSYDDSGRLETISAILPEGSQPSSQVTRMYYGADVVDSSHAAQSTHNGFIREVHFPDPATGQPSEADKFTFTYYSDGSVASRIDQRGVVFRHAYDELGRRIETTIDDSAWYPPPPPDSGLPDFRPRRRLSRIAYVYTPDGLLDTVTAYTINLLGVEEIVSVNTFTYDALRNLASEGQLHPSLVTDPPASAAPTVDYDWVFSPMPQPNADPPVSGYNFNRLARILYPQGPSGSAARREVEFHYGNNAGDTDSTINRITRIDTQLQPGGSILPAAQYAYMGTHRRVGVALGCNVSQTVADATGCPGLDRFGRLTDLYFTGGGVRHRYQYGHDRMGNRTFARVTQDPNGGADPHDNDRSYSYSYDALQRLIDASMGTLDSSNSAILSSPVPLQIEWGLDNLGNLTGDPAATPPVGLRRSGDFDGNGIADDPPQEWQHVVNAANEITQIIRHDEPATTGLIHDAAGNLVFDGDYVYQYDGWNRLVQVNLRGSLEISDGSGGSGGGGSGGSSTAPAGQFTGGVIGDLIARFTYDGLGRLILKETPVTTGVTALQAKHYYYDGVRRIAEVIDRPAPLEQPRICCMPLHGCVYVYYEQDCAEQGGTLLPPEGDCSACAWSCCLPTGACIVVVDGNDCLQEGGTLGLFGTSCDRVACPQPLASCCFANGQCSDMPTADCIAAGGSPGEFQSSCATANCEQPVACCFPSGGCADLLAGACVAEGGVPQLSGTTCDDGSCQVLRACCLPGGQCVVVTSAYCQFGLGGVVQESTECSQEYCVSARACCLPNGACQELTPNSCTSLYGVPQGPGSACEGTNCPAWQACCMLDQSCEDLEPGQCIALNGTPQGDATTCADEPPPDCSDGNLRACCLPDNSCQVMDQTSCFAADGAWGVSTYECTGVDCSNLGHCCLPDGSCRDSITIQACVALGGTMHYDSPSCAAAPCSGQPPQVACCLPSGVCSLATAIDCAMSCGRVVPGGSCEGVGCEAAQACCLPNGVCEDRTVQCCLAAGGTPQGSGTACICSCGTTYDCSNPPDPQLTGGGKDDESAMPVPAGGPQQIVERGGDIDLPGEIYLDREYVYGPDYVDEFVAQFDRDGHAIFMLQDGNYNVVALVSGPGHPGGDDGQGNPQPLPTGTVLEQYTYEPYGALVAAELYYPHAMNRAGHQGLFFERFDGSYDDYTLFRVLQGTAFITGAKGLYYNRNRFYSPTLCRFTTRDPNETAIPIITAMAMNGESLNILIGVINLRESYHDGMNPFQYVRSNPLRLTDPLGSFSIADAAFSAVIQSTISALVGGAMGGAVSWVRGGSMEDIESAVLSGFTGGFAGGVAGFAAGGLGLLARVIASGAVDGMFSRLTQMYVGGSYDVGQVITDMFTGALIAGVTHGILKHAPSVPRPFKRISVQKQARHAGDWAHGVDENSLIYEAYEKGIPYKGRPDTLIYDVGYPVGKNGETQVMVRVAKDNIHGHPAQKVRQ